MKVINNATHYGFVFGGGVVLDGPDGAVYVSPEGAVKLGETGHVACFDNPHRLKMAKEWATRAISTKQPSCG
jgi:hypothetical protein